MAIDNEGNLWAWGYNTSGQIGDGTTTNRTTPVQIKPGTKFAQISAGETHSMAIDNEGNLWAWGYNTSGQIGDETTTNRTTPVQIKPGTKFTQISAGYFHSLAMEEKGKVYGTGSAYYLGDPNLLMLTPERIN